MNIKSGVTRMPKRVVFILFAVLVLGVLPARANDPTPLDYIPADFAGFVQVKLTPEALDGLRLATIGASMLQFRIDPANFQSLDNYIPLALLDVEDASYQKDIAPWLNGEIIVAYHTIGTGLHVTDQDVLMILPTSSPFLAANSLYRIIKAQEHPKKDTYRNTVLYIGDRSTIAITPTVVFIGATDLVKAGLDRWAGHGDSLTAQPVYNAVRAASLPDAFGFAYLNGSNWTSALSVLLNGDASAEPLLNAFGEALAQFRDPKTFEVTVLGNSVDGIGVSLKGVRTPNNVKIQATATFHSINGGFTGTTPEFDPTVLNFVPRAAMLVDRGGNIHGAVYDFLAALPLSNFAALMLGGFPIQPSLAAVTGAVPPPTGEQIRTAVSSFLNTLDTVAGFKLDDDLLAHLSGSYAIALLPRPNNPLPVLNTPFDLLILAQTSDGDAALTGITRLFKTLSEVSKLDEDTVHGAVFQTLHIQPSGAAVVRFGVVDKTLIIATGDALEPALEAHDGNNRLINNVRWATVSSEHMPQLFVNLGPFYDTFVQPPGGQLSSQSNTLLLTANSEYLQNGLFQLQLEIHVQSIG